MKITNKRHILLILFLAIPTIVSISITLKIISLQSNKENGSFISNCKLCNIYPTVTPNSTRRDLVLTATTTRPERVELLVRSLRSVGCNARIVVLLPNGLDLPPHLINCGVESVHMTTLTARSVRSPHKIRWEWYYQYLTQHINEFDRILHCDAFDTFAQGDPFYGISKDIFYAVGEGVSIQNDLINNNWVKACHGDDGLKNISKNEVLCSGTTIGSSKLFLEVVEHLVSRPVWDECWSKGHDQGTFNHLFYTELQFSMTTKILGCQSSFLSMAQCSKNQVSYFDNKGRVKSKGISNQLPSFVHQYNRHSAVDVALQEKCNVSIDRNKEKEDASPEKHVQYHR